MTVAILLQMMKKILFLMTMKSSSHLNSKRLSTNMALSASKIGRTNLTARMAANATCLGPQMGSSVPLKGAADAFLDNVLLRATPTLKLNATT